MTTSRKRVAIDTNVLVALVDDNDKWHSRAVALRDALKAAEADLLYFDPVLNEAVSVLGRRAEEQKRSQQFLSLLDVLLQQVPPQRSRGSQQRLSGSTTESSPLYARPRAC